MTRLSTEYIECSDSVETSKQMSSHKLFNQTTHLQMVQSFLMILLLQRRRQNIFPSGMQPSLQTNEKLFSFYEHF